MHIHKTKIIHSILIALLLLLNACQMDNNFDVIDDIDSNSYIDSDSFFDSLTTEEPSIDSDVVEWNPVDNDKYYIENHKSCKWEIEPNDSDSIGMLMGDRFRKLTMVNIHKGTVPIAFGLLFDDHTALIIYDHLNSTDWFGHDATLMFNRKKVEVTTIYGYKRNRFWLVELDMPDRILDAPEINISESPTKDTCYTLYDFTGTYQTILFNGKLTRRIPEQDVLLFDSDWYLVGFVGPDYKFHRFFE